MNIKPKIKISEEAYERLLTLMNDSSSNYLKFAYSSKCCGNSINISLEESKGKYLEDSVEDLKILYDQKLINNINKITLVYKNSNFLVKFEEKEDLELGKLIIDSESGVPHEITSHKDCSGCNSKCSSAHGKCCS